MMLENSNGMVAADGIRDVDGSGSGINRGFHYAAKSSIGVRPASSEENSDVISVVTRAFNHIHRTFDHFIQRAAQLV